MCDSHKGHQKVVNAPLEGRQDLQPLDQEVIAFGSRGPSNCLPDDVGFLLTDLEKVSRACLSSMVAFLTFFKLRSKSFLEDDRAKPPSQRVATRLLKAPSLKLGLRLSPSPFCALSSVSPLLLLCCLCDCMTDPLQAQQLLAVSPKSNMEVRLHPEVFTVG